MAKTLETLKQILLILLIVLFIHIGPSLSTTIYSSEKHFKNFLNNSSLNSFVFKQVTYHEVCKLISQQIISL